MVALSALAALAGVGVAAGAVGGSAAPSGESAGALQYPDELKGPLKGDCTGGWEYHLSIASVTWFKPASDAPYQVTSADGVQLTSKMADGTFWTLDSSKMITGKLLFYFPPSQYAPYAIVSVPAIRHYPSGDTSPEDQGLGFGNSGTVKLGRGSVEVAFDRKFTIDPAGNLPGSTCESTGDFKATFKACEKEQTLVDIAQGEYEKARVKFLADAAAFDEIENSGFRLLAGPISGLASYARLSQIAGTHDALEQKFIESGDKFKALADELDKYKKELADCLKGTTAAASAALGARRPAEESASAKRPCTDANWGRLIRRGRALKLERFAPRARRIVSELKAGRRAQAAGDYARLKADYTAEWKRVGAFWKAASACR